jgi:hypothetical protein
MDYIRFKGITVLRCNGAMVKKAIVPYFYRLHNHVFGFINFIDKSMPGK